MTEWQETCIAAIKVGIEQTMKPSEPRTVTVIESYPGQLKEVSARVAEAICNGAIDS